MGFVGFGTGWFVGLRIGWFVGFGIGWFVSLAASPVLLVLVDFVFPVTFATGFFGLVSLAGGFFGTSLEVSIWVASGLVGMPREDSNRLAVFVWSDCTVVGVSVCAGGVICSTFFCGVVSGPGMVFILSAFKVGCIGEAGGFVSLSSSWKRDDSCSMPGLVGFFLAEAFVCFI